MKTKPASRQWMTVVLAVGAVGAYVYFAHLPGEARLKALRAELAAADDSIQQAEMLDSAIEATRKQADTTRQYVEKWEDSAPSEDDLSELFGRISQLIEQSGPTTTLFEPQEAVLYDTVFRLPVEVASTGSFAEVCRLLHGLEHQEETFWISKLRMVQNGEDSKDMKCEITLDIFADNPDGSGQVGRSE
jgi:Tfp pilus assembly protein PilO